MRTEVVPVARPGYVWDGGHWRWAGRGYVWVPGHWQPVTDGAHWVPGHWVQTRTELALDRRSLGTLDQPSYVIIYSRQRQTIMLKTLVAIALRGRGAFCVRRLSGAAGLLSRRRSSCIEQSHAGAPGRSPTRREAVQHVQRDQDALNEKDPDASCWPASSRQEPGSGSRDGRAQAAASARARDPHAGRP